MLDSFTQFHPFRNYTKLQYWLWRPDNWIFCIGRYRFHRIRLPWLCFCSRWSWWCQCANRRHVPVWWYLTGFHWSSGFNRRGYLHNEGICTVWWDCWRWLDALHLICDPRHHSNTYWLVWSWNSYNSAFNIPWWIKHLLQNRRCGLLGNFYC